MKPPRAAVVFFLLTIVLFLATSGYANLVCGNNIANPGATTVLRLSTITNAHGGTPTGSTYAQEIKCYETTGVSVGPGQGSLVTLLRLSNTTNAHGEEPGQAVGYNTPIVIGDSGPGTINVRVRNTAFGQTCANIGASFPYTEVVRLSSLTNAHMEIPGLANYPIIICAGYDPLGGAGPYVPEDLLQIDTLTHNLPGPSPPANPNPPLSSNNPGIITVPMRNMVFGSGGYDQMTTLQIVGICDMANVACQNIVPTGTGYANVETEINNFIASGSTFILPGTMRVNKYGSGTTFDSIQSALNTQGIPGQPFPTDLEELPSAVTDYIYNFTPAALGMTPGSTYKFFAVSYRAEFDYTLSAPPIVNGAEEISYRRNNIQTFVFDVTAPTTPPVTGTAGDVYLLKDIVISNVYTGSDIVANVTVENKRTDLTTTGSLSTIIRDSKGNSVPVWGVQVFPIDFSSGPTQTVQVLIQSGAVAPYLEVGKTYTFYASIPSYLDNVPTPIDESEIIIANNNGFKTLTTLDPPQSYSIPDFPAWMSVLVLSIVLGWLFFSTQKND